MACIKQPVTGPAVSSLLLTSPGVLQSPWQPLIYTSTGLKKHLLVGTVCARKSSLDVDLFLLCWCVETRLS